MASPIVFRSTDSDAPTISGVAGSLLTLLNGLLTIKRMFTGISGASFVDNTTEAQGNVTGQTAFKLFQGPTVSADEAYFGMPAKFDRITFAFGTVGVPAGVTLAWEYWNGTAWTALSGVVDGTSTLTVNGKVTFTIPTTWTTKSVNAVTCYWVRLRYTAGSWSTNPLVNYSVVTGWVKPFADASNIGAFQQGGGNLIFLSVNDNAPGTARDARPLGYETMSALQTGTSPWPAAEASTMAFRKSVTADATTRTWLLWADDRTFYWMPISVEQTAGAYIFHGFGEFFSFIPADAYRNFIIGDIAETAGAISAGNTPGDVLVAATNGAVTGGHYLNRAFHGLVVAPGFSKASALAGASPIVFGLNGAQTLTFPNPADGGLVVSPIYILEATTTLRGRMRGLFLPQHPPASFSDGATYSGANEYVGRTFLIVNPAGQGSGAIALETSDTVDAN